ncbi:stage II sporulation protein P [Scopulibacillus darangshiensis]|uniref:Stage II sporulation protein P n=1 Tax=Scopulibacillus darangshiensis TaxID=442528 RepID=A0A4R2NZI7_9BACL|nr:stage II sporulation protein P [Scopulibacillus darangshiensis]TCP27074.1 stage II sporulation protein P [Scopulibacillus darangshiensis]
MFIPYSSQQKPIFLKRAIVMLPVLICFLFIVISLLTVTKISYYLSYQNVSKALQAMKAETMVDFLGWENPYFKQVLPDDHQSVSLSKLSFQSLTNINFGDTRSLLGNELPGFSIFDTEIIVAGEGTNYSNVPVESSPPLDYLLKEKKKDKTDHDQEKPKPAPEDVKNGKVFLYSTHSYESYLPILGLTGAKDANKATSTSKNIHMVDEMFAKALKERGVKAVADLSSMTELLRKKNWTTAQAYDASRPIVKEAINSNKDYKLFIDVHRDSSRKKDTTAHINNKPFARVSFVIGKENPYYKKNLAITNKLHDDLNKLYPGLSKGIFEKRGTGVNGVYNQDLSPHVILIEVGGVDNTKEELQNTIDALARVVQDYLKNADKV